MAAAIGNDLAASCVILFGSRARGDHRTHSDVDLAVIVEQTALDAPARYDLREQAVASAAQIADGRFRRIDILIWTEPEYRTKKRSINNVAGRAWREGKILYGAHQDLPGEEIVSELDNTNSLIRIARRQINTMTLLLDEQLSSEEDFGFHAERATEVALKAWIALTGEQYPLPHNLAELFALLQQANAADTGQYHHLVSLTNYAVKYQYDEIAHPTMDRAFITQEVRALVDHVSHLLTQNAADSPDNND